MVGRRRGRSRPFADFLHRHYPNLARVVAREIVETANVLRDAGGLAGDADVARLHDEGLRPVGQPTSRRASSTVIISVIGSIGEARKPCFS